MNYLHLIFMELEPGQEVHSGSSRARKVAELRETNCSEYMKGGRGEEEGGFYRRLVEFKHPNSSSRTSAIPGLDSVTGSCLRLVNLL